MPSDKERIRRAAVRWGPTVDHLARNRYGISGAELLMKLAQGESGYRNDRTSSAGARGYTQFMPGTRAAVIQRFGIDPWRSADEAVHAAALHLRGRLGNARGLEGYNPGGGQSYVHYILNQNVGGVPLGSRSAPPPRGGGGRGGGRAGGGTPAAPLPGVPGFSAGTPTLAQKLTVERPAVIESAGVQAPSFAAGPVMPQGYREVQAGSVTPPVKIDIPPVAGQPADFGTPQPPAPSVATGAQPGRQVGGAGSHLGYPLGRRGAIIGTPHTGTHTLGNWQSDNAIDIRVPTGTPVMAVRDGTVLKVAGGYHGGASRFDGYQVTIRTANGNGVFYTHLSGVRVQAGDRIRRGQVIGKSGAANGVPHLHLGVEHGSPYRYVRHAADGGGGAPAGGGHRTIAFDGKPVLASFAPAIRYARRHGWRGTISSGVRTEAQQLAAARRFGLQHYPNGPLASNHVVGHSGAIDVTDPDGFERALRGFRGRKPIRRMADDPVHFSWTGH